MLIGFKNQYCEMAIFPEALYRLQPPSKHPCHSHRNRKKMLKLIWKQRNPMKPMNHHTQFFKLYYRSIGLKSSMAPAQKPDTIRLNQSKRQT